MEKQVLHSVGGRSPVQRKPLGLAGRRILDDRVGMRRFLDDRVGIRRFLDDRVGSCLSLSI